MNAALAGSLAALSSACLVAALGRWSRQHVLAPMWPVRRPEALGTLARIGRWPVVRHLPLSNRAAVRAETVGWDRSSLIGTKAVVALGAAAAVGALGGPVLVPPFVLLAYRVPDLWVARAVARRLRDIDREIPLMLDLLTVATSAGLPPQLALRRAVDAAAGPLAEKIGSVLNATELGGRWRDELGAASERLGLPDLRRLAGTLTRAETLGSSLEEEIARLATDVREARRAAATERARTAPVKMLFPLVFLVLPAFLLLTVVPVMVTTVRSIV